MFRELASRPVEGVDYLLGAAQGIVGWLALSREQNAGAVSGIAEIFGKALFMGSIYTRLGARAGKASMRQQVMHVLAYGGVPMVASLVIWVFTALLAGEAAFEAVLRPDLEGFVELILHAQFFAYVLLTAWGVVLQVMGLSEILGVAVRKALGLWVLGQLVGFLALLFLMIVIVTLFPNAMSS